MFGYTRCTAFLCAVRTTLYLFVLFLHGTNVVCMHVAQDREAAFFDVIQKGHGKQVEQMVREYPYLQRVYRNVEWNEVVRVFPTASAMRHKDVVSLAPVTWAMLCKQQSVVQKLLQLGSYKKSSPQWLYASLISTDVCDDIAQCLSQGAVPDAAFFFCAYSSDQRAHFGQIAALYKSYINVPDAYGNGLLHLAHDFYVDSLERSTAERGGIERKLPRQTARSETIKFLQTALEAGVDPCLVDRRGRSPLQKIMKRKWANNEVVRLFCERPDGATQWNVSDLYGVVACRPKLLPALLSSGGLSCAILNRPSNGFVALHHALCAASDRLEMAYQLSEAGADPNVLGPENAALKYSPWYQIIRWFDRSEAVDRLAVSFLTKYPNVSRVAYQDTACATSAVRAAQEHSPSIHQLMQHRHIIKAAMDQKRYLTLLACCKGHDDGGAHLQQLPAAVIKRIWSYLPNSSALWRHFVTQSNGEQKKLLAFYGGMAGLKSDS